MDARLACCLALALTIPACGDDERAAAPGGPDQPVSNAQAPDTGADGPGPASERACRRLGRRLVGVAAQDAAARAAARGCTLRVAVRDGRRLALTEDFQPARINVRVRGGLIAGVEFMG